MKKITRFLLFALSTLAVSAVFAASGVCMAQDSPTVDATLISFDNRDLTTLTADSAAYVPGDANGDGALNAKDILRIRKDFAGLTPLTDEEATRADIDCDGEVTNADLVTIRKILVKLIDSAAATVDTGNARLSWNSSQKAAQLIAGADSFAVRVDLSGYGFSSDSHAYCVIDCSGTAAQSLTGVSVTPLYGGCTSGSYTYKSEPVAYTAGGVTVSVATPGGKTLTGVIVSFEGSGMSDRVIYISGIYMCRDEYSAQWIRENAIGESKIPTEGTLSATLKGETPAVRLLDMTSDDKNKTNGGIYHDFKNCKWPSVAVDENDKLYVVCSGERMAHIDPFGATLMATSTNGGSTWSKPSVVSNTILDDRDAGVTYLGNGKLLVSYFTQSAANYMPGGEGYNDVLKPYSAGGQAPSWAAASWDANNHPVGGIAGTHVDILKYVTRNVSDYDTSASSFTVSSDDYGASWNTRKLAISGRAVTTDMANMVNNFSFDYPGTKVPVTSAHGPLMMSDGTLLYAGKVMQETDLPYDAMGVYTSTDEGESWQYLSEIPRPFGYVANNFHELSVTETASGTLVCAIRTQPSGSVNVTPMYTVYTCFSYDKGLTWTTPKATGLNGAPPQLVTMANGDIVVTHSCRTDPRCIYAAVSTDNGRTWSNEVKVSGSFLTGDDMGYPASAVLSDGTICTVYYGTYHVGSSNEGYSSILASRWTYTLR